MIASRLFWDLSPEDLHIPTAMSNPKTRPLQRAALIMAGIAAALVGIELAGHWAPSLFAFQPRRFAQRSDPILGYACSWHSEADSARDAAIIAFGDSYTGGTREIPIAEMYPGLLDKSLNRKVLNLGCSGYGTLQESTLAKRWVPRLKPRWVILGFSLGNDFVDSFDFFHWQKAHADVPYELYWKIVGDNMSCDGFWFAFHVRLLGRSVVYTVLYDFVRSRKALKNPRFQARRDTPNAVLIGREISLACLKEIQDLTTSAGARFLVVLSVDGRSIDTPPDHNPLNSSSRDFMARNGMLVIDPRGALLKAKKEGLDVFLPDGHWSPAGQMIVAALISDSIKASDPGPGKARTRRSRR